MLTESQYEELLRYKGDGIQYSGHTDEIMRFLFRKKYVILYHPMSGNGSISPDTFCVITRLGEDALQTFESQMHKERTEQEKNEKMMKKQRSANRFDVITVGTLSATIAAIIAGLIVLYWPSIVAFFSG